MADRTLRLTALAFLAACFALPSAVWAAGAGDAPSSVRVIASNDNTRPAGTPGDGVVRVRLVAADGDWQPEGPRSPRLHIAAFGEDLDSLVTPAPLLRASEGSEVIVQITNALADALKVHGLVTHPASNDVVVEVAPGATREVRFSAGAPGTYHYWATTSGKPLNLRSAFESQLSGAFIVDKRGEQTKARVFVLAEWDDRVNRQDDNPQPGDRRVFTINGQSWPYTDRIEEHVGETTRWHIVNLTLVGHPMHLHGFYFDVESLGTGLKDTSFAADHVRHVVTQQLGPGATMQMAWTPERPGNWLFHCHLVAHITPGLRFWESQPTDHMNHQVHDAAQAMTGLVVGIHVTGDAAPRVTSMPTRHIALSMYKRAGFWKPEDAYAFAMSDAQGEPHAEDVTVPGPTLVLTRNQPVEIALTNHLPEATAIHWHGIELESFYDGVPGFSGSSASTTPAIGPEETLTIRFTPPRAGTFIYHTHSHDERQLASGLYGAIVVLEPGETFDPSRDHVVLLGMEGAKDTLKYERFPVVVNGRPDATMTFKAGAPNRVRFINITTNFGGLNVSLLGNNVPVSWKPLAKDGAQLPSGEQSPVLALRQTISVGETFDFIVDAPKSGVLWLDVKRAGGEWVQQVRVPVVP